MRRWRHTLWLVAIWVLLWGELSVANALSGVLVAVVLGLLSPSAPSAGRLAFHPVGIAHLVGHFVLVLVRSNLGLIPQVLGRTSELDPGVIVVRLPGASDGLLTMVANMMALTPGNMPVGATADPPEIHLHLLRMSDEPAIQEEARILHRLGVAAFGHRAAGTVAAHPDPEDLG
jgi:multicomponent Na+:H+ antiporter subunit E